MELARFRAASCAQCDTGAGDEVEVEEDMGDGEVQADLGLLTKEEATAAEEEAQAGMSLVGLNPNCLIG